MLDMNPVIVYLQRTRNSCRTGGFKEELGGGAFGTVYKGVLANEDTPLIAVKKLGKIAREGEQEFKTEVRVTGRTNHKNSVQLIGFCNISF